MRFSTAIFASIVAIAGGMSFPSLCQAQQPATAKQVIRFADTIVATLAARSARLQRLNARAQKLSPRQQEVFVRRLPRGDFVNVPAFWRTVKDPAILFDALYEYGEPLTPPMLDALERHLSTLTSQNDRLMAAKLLYRYGRKPGTEMLVRCLHDYKRYRHRALLAASIFAYSRDRAFLALCAQVIAYDLEHDRGPGTWPLESTGDWIHPAFRVPLLHRFSRAPQDHGILIALAQQHITEVAPQIEQAYQQSSDDDDRRFLAAILLSLRPEKRDTLLPLFDTAFATTVGTDADRHSLRQSVLTSMDIIRDPHVLPMARTVIREYLDSPLPSSQETEEKRLLARRNQQDLVQAGVKALSRQPHRADAPLIEKLLLRLDQEDKISPSDMLPTAEYLYRIKPDSSLLPRIIGSRWVKSRQATRHLKPLIEGMPLETREFIFSSAS